MARVPLKEETRGTGRHEPRLPARHCISQTVVISYYFLVFFSPKRVLQFHQFLLFHRKGA